MRTSRFRLRRLMLLPPGLLGILGFVTAIGLGSIVLTTPYASASGRWTGPVDCIFTATSAACVTGLVVKQTGQYWSLLGQLVILALIQMGGIGIMTLSAFAGLMLRQRMTFRSGTALGQALDEPVRALGRLVKYIMLMTFTVEGIGAALLVASWSDNPAYGNFARVIYSSVFHSVSAFCNAGFSVLPNNLEGFRTSFPVNAIIMGLIVVGGLGFPVNQNITSWIRGRDPDTGQRPKLSVQSKLVLTVTTILIFGGAFLIWLLERNNALAGMGPREQFLSAMFQSVTTRTAGFNTLPMGNVLPATAFLMIVWMFIGASPASTGGGVKTTTIGTTLAALVATLRGRKQTEMFRHSISPDVVARVVCTLFLGMLTVVLGFFVLLKTESAPPLDTLFEVVSAFGTVGLSRGLTPSLSAVGKLTLCGTMVIGRLGLLSILMALWGVEDRAEYKYPEARLSIG